MGWHYTLELECIILPEYADFFKLEYLCDTDEIHTYNYCEDCLKNDKEDCSCDINDKYKNLSKSYLDLLDIWNKLKIGNYFYKYDFNQETRLFNCKISKKVTTHTGDLRNDYRMTLYDIIVPVTSEIISCCISSDDYGDERRYYTDNELRRIPFNLSSIVKNIQHTWKDGMITETRVIYKRSIKSIQQTDLDRCYGIEPF